MSQSKTIQDVIKEYDLDVLEIDVTSIYIHCGRGLSTGEFDRLGQDIKAIQESINE